MSQTNLRARKSLERSLDGGRGIMKRVNYFMFCILQN